MMRGGIRKTRVAIVLCAATSTAIAQMDLSGIKMAEPSPELPGDRAQPYPFFLAHANQVATVAVPSHVGSRSPWSTMVCPAAPKASAAWITAF